MSECLICKETTFEEPNKLIELSCNHFYCKDCLSSWFKGF